MTNQRACRAAKPELCKTHGDPKAIMFAEMVREVGNMKLDVSEFLKKNPQQLDKTSFDTFLEFQQTMKVPASYGKAIEKRIIKEFGWKKVAPSKSKGDAQDEENRFWEIKVSFASYDTSQVNFVQIRPHHKVDGYKLFTFKPSLKNIKKKFDITYLELSKENMQQELELLDSPLAHGTKEETVKGGNSEFAIRPIATDNDPLWSRWITEYKQEIPKGVLN